MSRTKDEMAIILTSRHTRTMFEVSTWSDLVDAIQGATPQQKDHLVQLLIDGKTNIAGKKLRDALQNNAKVRAKTYVDGILADDNLTLQELDSVL